MPTITEFRIPITETALGSVFVSEPTLECTMEQAVVQDFPNLWFTGAARADLEAAFDAEPAIRSYSLIADSNDRVLYDIRDLTELERAFEIVIDVGGTICNLTASGDAWTLTVRFSSRELASRAYERLEERPATVTIGRLYEGMATQVHTTGLTQEQHETLHAAIEHGYFDIPRSITMEELADELGVSHQAVSERLRRAYKTIVVAELDVDGDQDAVTESTPAV